MEPSITEKNLFIVEKNQKITFGLINHLYSNAKASIFASLLCSTILFYGLLTEKRTFFIYWYIFSIGITTIRAVLLGLYFSGHFNIEKQIHIWRYLFFVGSTLGAITWAIVSYWIFPMVSGPLETLTILIISGVTAGATPALASQKTAAISFLWIILLPLIFQIINAHSNINTLFGVTVIIYLIYLTLLSLRMHNTIKDVLQLQYQNISLLKKLKYLATHDPLTNLDNSRLFYENLSISMQKAKSKKSIVALLYIDLDKFKYVNDHYGHSMGDKVLKYTTDILRQQLGPNRFLARLGGDEFAVILEDIHDENSIIDIAKKICNSIEKPFVIENIPINISASIGISLYPTHGKNIDQLIKAADQAMYHVKKHGNNNFSFSQKKSKKYSGVSFSRH